MSTNSSAAELIARVRYWHPINRPLISLLVYDAPGLYVIRRAGAPVYIGRSLTSVKRRLLRHALRFPEHEFGVLYVRDPLRCMRYEYRLIAHLRRRFRLENRVEASICV